ncbi:MAG: hypothetical protein JWN27_2408 [Candidatus Eremiobacteraeota bacterium]|jgi:hypothetical protein|nr:hypothetical protein [Candidatus Eremiobacteraeota bacterium]
MLRSNPQTGAAAAAPRFAGLYRSLTINVVLPLIVAQWLLHQGRSPVVALGIAALFPLGDGVVSALRRRLDLLSVASLAALVVGIALSFATDNAAFAIAEKSAFTGLFGVAFLVSLLLPRPLIFHLGRQFNTAGDPAAQAAWDANWSIPGFRRVVRVMTAVWGLGLLAEAALRIVVALTMTPAVAIVVSPVLAIAAIALLILWTRRYAARARRRAAAFS